MLRQYFGQSTSLTRCLVRSTRAFASDPHNAMGQNKGENSIPETEEIPDPPGFFTTVGAMGAGAGGAVAIAVIGVVAVFKMAFWVAGETGRSLRAGESVALENATAETKQQ